MNHRAPPAFCKESPLFWEIILLICLAIGYYGHYWRSGLMISGDDGVVAIIAQRLNEGERPFVDTFIGYNIGWFYPIAYLFKIGGANYLILRGYFFLIGILSGLVAYCTISLTTQNRRLALAVGFLIIMIPGAIGRNYMGLFGNLGILTLLIAFVLPHKTQLQHFVWMVISGCTLALAWLVRIDIGFFQTVLFLLTLLLASVQREQGLRRRLTSPILAILILGGSFFIIHCPVYYYAKQHSFSCQFVKQYVLWPSMLKEHLKQLLYACIHPHDACVATFSSASNASTTLQDQPSLLHKKSQTYSFHYNNFSLKRPPLQQCLYAKNFKDRLFACLIYLPVLLVICFTSWGILMISRSLILQDPVRWQRGRVLLISTGGALILFPQYFFWRPDMIHLADFMAPFMVSLFIGIFFAFSELGHASFVKRCCLLVMMFLAVTDLFFYIFKGLQTDGTGSFASARGRHLVFMASNGVNVRVNPQEFLRLSLLRDTIMRHSKASDYLICFPYFPMINFMTDRRSYQYNLYADNAIPSDKFFNQTKKGIEQYHPAIIVIGNGAINNTEDSRFQNWAYKTYEYIRKHYSICASDKEIEIYMINPSTFQAIKKLHP